MQQRELTVGVMFPTATPLETGVNSFLISAIYVFNPALLLEGIHHCVSSFIGDGAENVVITTACEEKT